MDIEKRHQIEECAEWIIVNKFTNVALQFNLDDIANSPQVVVALEQQIAHKYRTLEKISDISYVDKIVQKDTLPRIYITQPSTCCADLIVTQHVTGLDAVIHFGTVCLTQPIVKSQMNIPILYIFGGLLDSSILSNIKFKLDEALGEDFHKDTLVIFDTSLLIYVDDILTSEPYKELSFAKLIKDHSSWHFSRKAQKWIVDLSQQKNNNDNNLHRFGHFVLSKPIKSFKRVVHLGRCNSLLLKISSPNEFLQVTVNEQKNSIVNPSRLLTKRIALVERLKNDNELRIGVIITNPIPDIANTLATFKNLAKRRKHILYFITMIQTIDECKIGNFDLCDAFVVVNCCFCSTILEGLNFNRPILNEWEFRLVCGSKLEYGGIMWQASDPDGDNSFSSEEEEHDRFLKRKASDVSLSLMHTRNELLEKCYHLETINSNRWFGMDYKPELFKDDEQNSCDDTKESTDIREGLVGIASHYRQEPSTSS